MGGMLMDYMKEIKEISAEQAIILWQASRLSLSKIYEKAPEILKVQGSVIGTLGNFSASIGKAKSKVGEEAGPGGQLEAAEGACWWRRMSSALGRMEDLVCCHGAQGGVD